LRSKIRTLFFKLRAAWRCVFRVAPFLRRVCILARRGSILLVLVIALAPLPGVLADGTVVVRAMKGP
jgi:hypothetical protein